MRRVFCALVICGMIAAASAEEKPRVIVLTDITSIQAGVREPDDCQTLIRFMLYACDFDIEGFIASSNLGHGQQTRPELVRTILSAYGKVRDNLNQHRPGYPAMEKLLPKVKAGQPIAGPKVPATESVGEGKDTEGSTLILEAIRSNDMRPLWVLAWGGTADLAQALYRLKQETPPEFLPRMLAKLRIHAIGDQDSTGPWIRNQFPGLFYILRGRSYRGMYRGGDAKFCQPAWVDTHIKIDHGPLGELYPIYDGGDIWSSSLGRVKGIKEGDTPSFLNLIPNGLSDPEHPEWGGWGGREKPSDEAGIWSDAEDQVPGSGRDPDPRISSVYRWRAAVQNDFAARMDWCVKPREAANHAPVVALAGGGTEIRAKPGDRIILDGSASRDPDTGQSLAFRWWVYDEAGTGVGYEFTAASASRTEVLIPSDTPLGVLRIVFEASDSGEPKLTSYGRVNITVGLR